MRRLVLTLAVSSLVGFAFASTAMAAEAKVNKTLVGSQVDDFTLRDFRGKVHHLADYADRQVVVLAFLGVDCPLVKLYAPRLNALAEEFAERGVALLGINSNVQDTPTDISAFANRHGISFPILKDAGNVVADQVGAMRTPEIFVLDEDRVVRYHGRVDDQYGVGYQRASLSRRDLAEAVEELLAGKEVSVATTAAPGCFIGRVREIEPHGDVTYANQVSRILNRRCVECHRGGELAPFPLTSYDEVIGWGDTIREVVDLGRMPPWFADPRYGEFSNDCRMSDEEKKLLFTWIDNGMPEGDPGDLPEPPQFITGWRIGEPDLVFRMEEPFTVPAEGTVDYQHFIIDTNLEEDVWIQAAEARPGNTSVVHHIVAFAAPKGATAGSDRRGQVFGQMLAVYAPGMPPWQYPEGTAMRMPAGSRVVLQMHYTPNGTEQEDASYVGFRLADPEQVSKRIRYGIALNTALAIPPHDPDHQVVAKTRFRRDTLLLNLFPHMHYRGKSFRFDAIYPDGTTEVLLDVPNYDFNWQLRYDFAEPKRLPGGTTIVCTGHFDNSADNPRNPDPDETVRFGLQSWEEMLAGYYTIVPAHEDLTADEDD